MGGGLRKGRRCMGSDALGGGMTGCAIGGFAKTDLVQRKILQRASIIQRLIFLRGGVKSVIVLCVTHARCITWHVRGWLVQEGTLGWETIGRIEGINQNDQSNWWGAVGVVGRSVENADNPVNGWPIQSVVFPLDD